MLVSNSSLELSGRDNNSAAIGAEPRWLSCSAIASAARDGAPEVGLLLDHEFSYIAGCNKTAAAFLGNAA